MIKIKKRTRASVLESSPTCHHVTFLYIGDEKLVGRVKGNVRYIAYMLYRKGFKKEGNGGEFIFEKVKETLLPPTFLGTGGKVTGDKKGTIFQFVKDVHSSSFLYVPSMQLYSHSTTTSLQPTALKKNVQHCWWILLYG